ncbi:MAG: UDP-N-acetylglucosamine 1-carboxyvinyltransferase [Fimbriimonadaceae bacterium]
MEAYKIQGGRRLHGVVDVKGSKNTALALMSAVVLSDGVTVLHNIPNLSDTRNKASLLESFGVKTEWDGDKLWLDCANVQDGQPDEEDVRAIRTSFYLLGPLLARIGNVTLPAPGGCKIGARPVNLHLRGLELLGADVRLEGGCYTAKAERLRGAEIYLDFPSAGATQHLMTTACYAEGMTVIQNAAMEPEVTALAEFLNSLGARVEGAGTSTVTVMGANHLKGAEFRIPSDRLQAGTYLLAGAVTGGDVTVKGILPEHQTALVNKLREAGADVEEGFDWVRLRAEDRLKPINVMTMPYPGFPTDMQQPMAGALTVADGTSLVEETIYESRIGHIQELNRMGAQIRIEGRTAVITGVKCLKGATVEASDLRAGAALCLAGLAAQGTTLVKNIHFIDRGYEAFETTLAALGADISRTSTLSGRGVKP